MTTVVMIGLNLAVLIGMGLFFHKRIENRMKPDQLIAQLREEVNGVVADLNQATDRNITLLEDRLKELNKALERADRAVKVLQRESQRRERAQGDESSDGPWRYNDILQRAAPRREPPKPPPAVPEDSAPPDPAPADSPQRGADQAGRSGGAGGDGAGGQNGRAPSKKERILDLHRKGIAPNIIAGRVGSTVGEVELVISLSEGTG
jgi:hypothetical protein